MILSRAFLALAALPFLFGCATETKRFEIRRRDPQDLHSTDALNRGYKEEYQYIGARRTRLFGARRDALEEVLRRNQHPDDHALPDRLVGLALSGGGIRSATFNLGTLQALHRSGVLSQVDYISAVSGGGYVASWYQAHLAANARFVFDRYGFEVGPHDHAHLFSNHGDSIEHLRTHSGFINRGRWLELPALMADYLWRWPLHVIIDDVAHARGVGNFHHIVDIYRSRIESTYLRGNPPKGDEVLSVADTPLIEINNPGAGELAPYLILGGNLTNQGPSQVGVKYRNESRKWYDYPWRDGGRDQWNFEFTRHFSGSDATGYVQSEAFAAPVKDVMRDATGIPRSVEVRISGADDSRFKLSNAAAASGAAFDSLALGNWVQWWGLSELTQLVGSSLLNLNLGLEVPNFSRDLNGLMSVLDYVRMFTYQRIPRLVSPGARWLFITDGGHYDNLGVLSLLRRGTQCVIAIDATADPKWKLDDLRILRRRVGQELGLIWSSPLPEDGREPVSRFSIYRRDGSLQSMILYVKANARRDSFHLKASSSLGRECRRGRSSATIMDDFGAGLEALCRLGNDASVCRLQKYAASLQPITNSPIAVKLTAQENRKRLAEATAEIEATSAEIENLTTQVRAACSSLLPAQTHGDKGKQSQSNGAPSAEEETGSTDEQPEIAALETCSRAKEDLSREQAALESSQAETIALELQRERIRSTTHPVRSFEAFIAKNGNLIDQAFSGLDTGQNAELARLNGLRYKLLLLVERTQSKLENLSSCESQARASDDRIRRIGNFEKENPTFPHDSTLNQTYEWERFEAYRELGYQMATSYLEPLSPAANKPLDEWCRFAPESEIDLQR